MKFWNENITNLEPYVPGEQPKSPGQIIKLNTNENPYPPSPKVLNKLKEIHGEALTRYPEANWNSLRNAISKRYHIPVENIFCSNGSDEILSLIFRCFLSINDLAVIPYPNYTLYETLAQSYGVPIRYIQSDNNFNIHFEELLAIESKVTFFSNPNAPTGKYYNINKIYEFCKNYSGLFILDEAYIDFGGESGLSLISKLDNLLIVRTMSKSFSLAGLRLGYAFGDKSLIDGMIRAKDSYNLSYLSQTLGIEAINDYDYMLENARSIIQNREFLSDELRNLGFNLFDSKTNFLLAGHPDIPGEVIYQQLKEKGILVRHFNHRRLKEYIRITIGRKGDLNELIRELKNILKNK